MSCGEGVVDECFCGAGGSRWFVEEVDAAVVAYLQVRGADVSVMLGGAE